VAYHNIASKVDKALVAYLISQGAGTTDDVFAAKRAGTQPCPPFTVVFTESWAEAQEYSGALLVKCSVEVHTNAAPDKDEDTATRVLDSDERVQATGDALMNQTSGASDGYGLGEEITAAGGVTDFTCISARLVSGEQGRDEKQGEWVDVFNLELLCTPSDVS
jgi:hypothetical protein